MCLRGFPDGSVVKNPPASAGTAAAKSLQSCLTVWPHRWQPTRLPRPWDSPGKNAGVGCHFLLQCRKVKSESEVAQSCPTLHNPMDCSLRGSSVHGIFQARVLEWGAGDTGSIPGLKDPLEKEMVTHSPVFLPGKSHGQRSLTGYRLTRLGSQRVRYV